ncbi:MAG TPA: Gfo/Idh/MocA family oxidoreductase, partial [Saprospiraceae bacterium]|nr:Gfo/Idh/MocA family oxidoreductase [Saprospiraceae bacterium]
SICSPNYLHDAHCRYGLRHGADVVCEKPLVLHPHNLEALRDMERETGRRVWNVLQLRHHPQIVALKEQSERQPQGKIFDVELTYVTPRGKWYYASWKGEPSKSGGIITNIGIHLFDMLLWVFGPLRHAELHLHTHGRAAGFLQLERARVRWFLSIENLLAEGAEGEQSGMPEPPQGGGTAVGHPRSVISSTQPRRTLLLDGHAWDFSEGFTDLHTECYAQVLAGRGWSIEDAAAGIELTWQLRQMPAALSAEGMHPWVAWPTQPHPFYAP